MVEPDENLIQECVDDLVERALRGVQAGRARDALDTLIAQYRLECELSQGPDKGRADHWSVMAKQTERQLRRRLNFGTRV